MMSSSQAPFTYLAPPRPPPPRKHLGPSPPSCCKAGEGSPPRRAPPPLRLPRRCWTLPRYPQIRSLHPLGQSLPRAHTPHQKGRGRSLAASSLIASFFLFRADDRSCSLLCPSPTG